MLFGVGLEVRQRLPSPPIFQTPKCQVQPEFKFKIYYAFLPLQSLKPKASQTNLKPKFSPGFMTAAKLLYPTYEGTIYNQEEFPNRKAKGRFLLKNTL